jgi:hypothetical protein
MRLRPAGGKRDPAPAAVNFTYTPEFMPPQPIPCRSHTRCWPGIQPATRPRLERFSGFGARYLSDSLFGCPVDRAQHSSFRFISDLLQERSLRLVWLCES